MMANDKPPLTWSSRIATVYPLGFMPKAPGTWGSLPGLVIGWALYAGSEAVLGPGLGRWLLVLIGLGLLGFLTYVTINKTEAAWQSHDDKRIVIDEVLGQAIPVAFFAGSWLVVLVSFVMFRFFDIIKPGPIGWADRKLPGAWGTLLDDVFAGLAVLIFWLLVVVIQA